MIIFGDTNVFIRHLAGDPSAMAMRATAFLEAASEILVPDLIVAETVYVLQSYYDYPRSGVADAIRSLLRLRSIRTVDPAMLLRAIQIYEVDRLDFAEAYLVALAESTGIGSVASFDRAIDRVHTVVRVEP